jgi:1,4-alpha-glucan branching enzyme
MSVTQKTLPDGAGLVATDPWLEPYIQKLAGRQAHYRHMVGQFDETGGLLGQISQGHHFFGLNRGELFGKPGVWYREWAPGALQLRVIGDFNNWDRFGHPMTRDSFGVWSLFFPDDQYASKLVHGSRVKVHVVGEDSSTMDRIPAYIRRAVRDERTGDWAGIFWEPPKPFEFKHAVAPRKGGITVKD